MRCRCSGSTFPHDMQILVVDDSSPDGTADVVRMKQASISNLHLLMGQKSGLGAAYIRGMFRPSRHRRLRDAAD